MTAFLHKPLGRALTDWIRPSQAIAFLGVIFIAIPVVIVVVMSFGTDSSFRFPPRNFSFGSYGRYFTEARWLYPTLNSVIIALGTTVLTMVLTIPAALAFARESFAVRSLVRAMIMMPLTVPHIVMALAYFSFFGSIGILATHVGVIIAHTCISIPIAFLIITANLKGFDWTLVRASRSLGATPTATFFNVILPVLRPGFLIASLFAFINSFDETVIAIFVSGRAASTLPRRMFESVRQESDPVVAVVSTLLFALVIIGFVTVKLMQARRAARLTAAKAEME